MIEDIFIVPEKLSSGQKNWLKVMSVLPEIKQSMGDLPVDEDYQLANDAKSILRKNNGKVVGLDGIV